MPNRILREGILTSMRVNSLEPKEEVFYRRLMSVVDDFGRYFAAPMPLRAACFPMRLDCVSDKEILSWLGALSQVGLLRMYEVNGSRYLELIDFRQQQRAKKSKYPDPVNGSHVEPLPTQTAETKKDEEIFILPDWIPPDTWKAWLKTRTKKRASNDAHALKLSIGDLEMLKGEGNDPRLVLEQSVKRGWTGLFPLKGEIGKPSDVPVGKKCAYCPAPAVKLTNDIPHCARADHLDFAVARRT